MHNETEVSRLVYWEADRLKWRSAATNKPSHLTVIVVCGLFFSNPGAEVIALKFLQQLIAGVGRTLKQEPCLRNHASLGERSHCKVNDHARARPCRENHLGSE
jgi:hypothetical protein